MDQHHISKSKRIAKNTFLLSGRMLFGMLVSLYTSRLILQALGVDDYGIYGVVGGLVVLFSIISSSLQAAITRYITFELGINDLDRIQKTFSTAFMIQAMLAIAVFITGETIGVWFLNKYMVIEPDRLFAANIVFQASIFSFMLGLILMPYHACINAHEHMGVYAYLSILDIMLKLLVVIFIAYAPWHFDRLIAYALLLVFVGIIMQIISVSYCRRNFEETKVKWQIDNALMKSMSKFAGWNFIGAASGLLREQGGNILLNIFFGPAINATYSIAGSVARAVGGFSSNFMIAVNPQITKTYASEDRQYMMNLIFRASRIGFLAMLFIGLPILFNTDYILELWLKTPPVCSSIFVRLILIFSMIETLSAPLVTAMLATGDIKRYQIIVGGITCCTLPAFWIVLKLGSPAYSIFIVSIMASILAMCARIWMLKYMIGLPAREFLLQVCLRCIYVFVICCIPAWIAMLYMPYNIWGLIMSVIMCLISSSLIILYIGLYREERVFIFNKIKQTILNITTHD